MLSNRNSKPSVDGTPVVVTARTLKEAYNIVREEYGADAVILGTRNVNRRQELGLGHEKRIEVTVQAPELTPARGSLGSRRNSTRLSNRRSIKPAPAPSAEVNQNIIREVERIEELVESLAEDHARLSKLRLPYCNNPLAETLIENGASPEAVNALLTRFTSETGSDVHDRPAAVAWLTENLRASNCAWEDFYGCHAFLGDTGSGRTDMVLSAASVLQGLGRRTLVLSLMPGDNGVIRRLQLEASQQGFDAAVIRNDSQLATTEKHLSEYDVVLVDMPHLRHETMAEGGVVHGWLARNSSFHRHLLVPMDKDPRDMGPLKTASRIWNCDWIAVSRTDMTERSAKMLDLLEKIPVPVSLVSRNPVGQEGLEIAQSDRILDGMLGSNDNPTVFESGIEPMTTETQTAEVAW